VVIQPSATFDSFGDRAAVIDLGSNSARVVVVQPEVGGHFAIIEEERVPLRLARRLVDGELTPDAIEDCLATIARFRSIAAGAGTTRIHAVATAAIREARNSEVLVQRAWAEFGVVLRIIDGEAEARLAALGAMMGLPVEDGFVLDIGGASCEVAMVRERAVEAAWTFPFGALRATDTYLLSDPARPREIADLRKAVAAALSDAGLSSMVAGQTLVGTGGTIRNVAKMDRRPLNYPVERLHGYPLRAVSIHELAGSLASLTLAERLAVPGLNPDRADSIVGGLVVLDGIAGGLAAETVLVSGQGIREGVLAEAAGDGQLAPAEQVRRSSVEALARRFRGWRAARARHRAQIVANLFPVLDPLAPAASQEIARHACVLVDIGAFIDFYNRHRHTADIVLDSDLVGFSHQQLVLLAAAIRLAEKDGINLSRFAPLLDDAGQAIAARLGAIIALAEELQRHTPPEAEPAVGATVDHGVLRIISPFVAASCPAALAERIRSTFGLQVELRRA
jgi:exopolyphosphatase/guanosine-5'-triphosphate,3'-diphosphate pyrophosphatase